MITLYKKKDCAFCDEIEAGFREIVLAYKIGNTLDLTKEEQGNLPLIIENEKRISGKSAITAFLNDTKQLMTQWQKFQSDSCYLDGDGKVC
ncbi:MAG: hypothetical protein D8M58_05390 [Calditrichaeota bacterium]|nr:MAG: hypothetical protein DWQ03_21115 [Calditrichota bacterium]MBL1204809.1 hypothetical protein [Calditrichota bacterium]NOG44638.1 hypothetical protein [Calditrichota bacterium]